LFAALGGEQRIVQMQAEQTLPFFRQPEEIL